MRMTRGAVLLTCGVLAGGCATERPLDIYFIDVMGGAATLIVTPEQESILIDSGWPEERDADRILHVVQDVAGLDRIDHVITTHWHVDHYGALQFMEDRVVLGAFWDRGIPDETLDDPRNFPTLIAAYRRASRHASVTLRPGNVIPLRQGNGRPLKLQCLMSSGEPIAQPPGAPDNPYCAQHEEAPPDTGDNGQSTVLLLSYGDFTFFHAGDLTWNFEKDLVCPRNPVGQVELFQVTHHGLASSNNPVLVNAIAPRVAVMCNGPEKGGAPEVVATLRESPRIEDIWQLHRNVRSDEARQPPASRTANWDDPDAARYIHARVAPDGRSYRVRISPGGPSASYRTDHDRAR